MEIKDGYKLTEIGVIPKDWEVVTYDDAFHFLSTASYSRAQISKNGDIGYIHYGDIHTRWKHFLDMNENELPFINKEQLKTYSLLKEGDLVMADASEDYLGIGETIEVKNVGDKNIISGLHTFLLRSKEGLFVNGFKGYIHSNKTVKNQFDRLATGLKVYGVTKTNLKTVKIPLPPLPEQKAIAEVLSDMDNLITGLERQIEKKRLVKQGAMQRLLTAGEDWEEITFGEAFNFLSTASYSRAQLNGIGEIGYIHYGDIHVKWNNFLDFDLKELPFIEKDLLKSYPLIKEGDIVMADASEDYKGIGASIEIKNLGNRKVIAGLHTFLLRDKGLFFKTDFKGYIQNIPFVKKQLDTLATGLKVYSISKTVLKQIKIPLPPLSEQTRIATILSDMDKSIESMERELSKYRGVKVGLMQELLSGRKRLVRGSWLKT